MNARIIAAVTLSAVWLAGCADGHPLEPDAGYSLNDSGVDRLPPLPADPPGIPLPPIEGTSPGDEDDRGSRSVSMNETVNPEPPLPADPPGIPLPPIEGVSPGDEDDRGSRSVSSNETVNPEPPLPADPPVQPLPPAEPWPPAEDRPGSRN